MAETATMEKQSQKKVSFTVAECSEFHNMGELHENVATVKEAVELFQQIPPERMNGVPAIGIRVTDVANPELFTEIDIVTEKVVDMEVLSFVPEIAENKAAQFAIAELIYRLPEAEVRGRCLKRFRRRYRLLNPGKSRRSS